MMLVRPAPTFNMNLQCFLTLSKFSQALSCDPLILDMGNAIEKISSPDLLESNIKHF